MLALSKGMLVMSKLSIDYDVYAYMYDHIWRHCGKILADVGKEDVYMDSGHDGNIDDAEDELYLEVALEFLLLGLRKTSPWVGVPAKA